MIYSYISNEETIILNVMQCVSDAKTCKSLEMSRKVDPNRERTLLVLTKIDRIETISDLNGKYQECQLKYGFNNQRIFFTRNRSDKENENNSDIAFVRKQELIYFQKNLQYLKNIPNHCKGIKPLTDTLVLLQKERIFNILPKQIQTVRTRIHTLEHEINQLGQNIEGLLECIVEISNILLALFEKMKNSKDGVVVDKIAKKSSLGQIYFNDNVITSGPTASFGFGDNKNNGFGSVLNEPPQGEQQPICSKIQQIFDVFKYKIHETTNIKDFTNDKFLKRIKDSSITRRGFRALPDELHPSISVEIISDIVEKTFKNTSIQLTKEISNLILDFMINISNQLTHSYPRLKRRLNECIRQLIHDLTNKCNTRIEELIAMEKTRPFTMNHYYMSTVHKMEQLILAPGKDIGKKKEKQKKKENNELKLDEPISDVNSNNSNSSNGNSSFNGSDSFAKSTTAVTVEVEVERSPPEMISVSDCTNEKLNGIYNKMNDKINNQVYYRKTEFSFGTTMEDNSNNNNNNNTDDEKEQGWIYCNSKGVWCMVYSTFENVQQGYRSIKCVDEYKNVNNPLDVLQWEKYDGGKGKDCRWSINDSIQITAFNFGSSKVNESSSSSSSLSAFGKGFGSNDGLTSGGGGGSNRRSKRTVYRGGRRRRATGNCNNSDGFTFGLNGFGGDSNSNSNVRSAFGTNSFGDCFSSSSMAIKANSMIENEYKFENENFESMFNIDCKKLRRMSNKEQIIYKECIKIAAYYKVVCKRLIDYICMYSWHYLIELPCMSHDSIKEKIIKDKLSQQQSDQDWLLHLMSVDPTLKMKRQHCQMSLTNLKEAYKILKDITILAE